MLLLDEPDAEFSSLSRDEMRLLRVASWASSASMRLSAELLLEPLVLAVVPDPVVPQAVSAISTAVAAIGRNIFDAPIDDRKGNPFSVVVGWCGGWSILGSVSRGGIAIYSISLLASGCVFQASDTLSFFVYTMLIIEFVSSFLPEQGKHLFC